MSSLYAFLRAVAVSIAVVVSTLGLAGGSSAPATAAAQAQPVSGGPCGLSQAAFCDTFDRPAGTGNRAGQLDGTVWGVSRTTGNVNVYGGAYNAWAPTQLQGCSGTATVQPPNDVIICDGQLREASNDGETVTVLAMYPKQPFDFAGRTGKVTFDVGNDSQGIHTTWPEFWITDKPIPAPFTHQDTWRSLPQHGLGVRLAGFLDENGVGASCPQGSNPPGSSYIGVSGAVTVNNYVANDTENDGTLRVHGLDCVRQPTQLGQLNHYEMDISQQQIDVYGTDAGTTAPLKHLASIPVDLSFTRGLVWIEDAHYNAAKGAELNGGGASQRQHTFVWDNVGFDGPFTYRDLSFDALDANTNGGNLLGKLSAPNKAATWDVLGMPANPSAKAVRVMFNFSVSDNPSSFLVTVNGHPHTVAWPFPGNQGSSWRTLETSIPITDLVPGTNVVMLQANQAMVTSNVNIVLVDAGNTAVAAPAAPSVADAPVAAAAPPAVADTPVAPVPTVEIPLPASAPALVAAVGSLLSPLSHAAVSANGDEIAAQQISLSVPAGVVGPSGGELNLLALETQSVPTPAAGFQLADSAFAITVTDSGTGLPILQPAPALLLQYRLSQAEIDQAGGDATGYQMVNWSGDEWVPLACTTDAVDLNCAVPRLGLFALLLTSPRAAGE